MLWTDVHFACSGYCMCVYMRLYVLFDDALDLVERDSCFECDRDGTPMDECAVKNNAV